MKRSSFAVGSLAALAAITATHSAAAAAPVVGSTFPVPGSLAAAWGCATALVAWQDGSSLRVSRIDLATKAVLDPTGVLLSTHSSDGASIAFDGTNYMVVWYDGRPPSATGNSGVGVYAARVRESDGALVDAPNGFPVMTQAYYADINDLSNDLQNFSVMSTHPAVGFSAGNFLVVDSTDSTTWGVTGSRIRATDAHPLDGTAMAPWFTVISSLDGSSGLAVAGGSADFLVTNVESEESAHTQTIRSTLISSSAGSTSVVGGVAVVGDTKSPIVSTSVASNGLTFFLAYGEMGDVVNDMSGLLVSRSVSEPPPIQFSSSYAVPTAAYDGKNFIAAWVGGVDGGAAGVYAARVDPADGTLVDSTPFQISTQNQSAILAGGLGGTSLAVQGSLGWLISEEADAGMRFSCPSSGAVDAGGPDAGQVASEGGIAGATPDGSAGDAGIMDATLETGRTLSDAEVLEESGLESSNDGGMESGAMALVDAARREDATTSGEFDDSGASESDASSPSPSSSGCGVGPGRTPDSAAFLALGLVFPLSRRRRRGL